MSNAYINILKPLIGGKIKKIIVDPTPNGDVYMGLIVENGKKTYEIVGLSDAEGNGAGHLAVTLISDFRKRTVDSAAST